MSCEKKEAKLYTNQINNSRLNTEENQSFKSAKDV